MRPRQSRKLVDGIRFKPHLLPRTTSLLLTAAAALSLLCLANKASCEQKKNVPNIVLILTDDQGYGDLGCHGNPHLKTPHLDRLHRESVRLTDFHVSPTCAPTRSALLTGRHEFFNGVTHTVFERERMSLKATTLSQVLKQAGYATGIFGKWHLGDEDAYQPGVRGFDEVFIHGGGGIGQSYLGSCGDAPGNRYLNPAIRHNGTFEKTTGYCTDVFFDQATKWIASVKGKSPFFCLITPNAPHDPLDCPAGSDKPYAGKVPADVAKFYGMIANIDDNVGRLLEKLDAWGIEKDTLVIFMTDNGTATGAKVFNAGMRGAKGSPYRGGTRVPSFWRWPGTLPAGVDVSALTCHWDVLPTLAALAGAPLDLKVTNQVTGRSLLPLLRNAQADWPRRTFVTHVGRWDEGKAAEARYAHASIQDGHWALVFHQRKRELYDLRADPGEKTNVAAQHPDVVEQLVAAYDRWWDEVLPCLENENVVGPKVNPFKAAYEKQFGGRGAGTNDAPPRP
ncbi:MAG: arylsulfatase [Planctomycetes bacterium]|nr:arylsulfatase [Planctomycetota bacterium]